MNHGVTRISVALVAAALACDSGEAKDRLPAQTASFDTTPWIRSKVSIYDATVAGMSCKQADTFDEQLDCDYRVGTSLYFVIAGVGGEMTSVMFMRSDFDGDYYGSMGMAHGCVTVKAGKARPFLGPKGVPDYAFVSPKNGKVYRTWEDCQSAR